ncbi:hypothetical protein CFP56_029583 [Quercus suber]|uniref:PB1-like domain-containing protein n=1 Tax=Quercus suber TaxID=58331 RepID=A0AAW0JQ40_QUESU
MDEDFQFTICLHYGGKFKNNPFRYDGGKIKKHEDYNSNEMSMIEMISIIREFGYGPLDLLLYRDPGLPFVGGLKPLVYDNDVVKMVEIIRGHYEVELYVTFLEDFGQEDTNNRKGGERAKVDNGAIKEYDSACEVHFGGSESDNDDMFHMYIGNKEVTPIENTKGKEIYEETSINGKKQNAKGVKRKKSRACRNKATDGSGSGDVGPSVKVSGPKVVIDGPRGTTTKAIEDRYVSDTSASLVGNRDPILPPPHRRQPGRPKNLRKRERDEPRNPYKMPRTNTQIRCSQCGVLGHNKRRCKDNEALNQPRKKPVKKKNGATNVASSSGPKTSQELFRRLELPILDGGFSMLCDLGSHTHDHHGRVLNPISSPQCQRREANRLGSQRREADNG